MDKPQNRQLAFPKSRAITLCTDHEIRGFKESI
jgi:hypothetical protein